jgi:hypothetical protein
LVGYAVPAPSAAAPAPSSTQIDALHQAAPRLSLEALNQALSDLKRLQASGVPVRSDVLAVIDYSKPSTEKRLWVFDLVKAKVLFEELVAHGKNTGDNMPVRFSNAPNSLMTSLGAFLTGETYQGKHGLSLRLEGMDKGVNDKSLERGIVIHAAQYVSESLAKIKGRIGRSWGCPAVRPEISQRLIETLKGHALLVAYAPDARSRG